MSRIVVSALVIMAMAVPVFAGEAVTYQKHIKGIVARQCVPCHASDAPSMEKFKQDQEGYKKKMRGPKADTYKDLMVMVKGSDAGALMRRLDDGKNTKDGKPGNMHVYLGATDEERSKNFEIFKKWVGNWTLKRKAELSDKELKAIKAPEK